MKLDWSVELAGTGMFVPERAVSNDEIAKLVDTTNEWIVQRTGIESRHWVGEGDSTLTMAAAASRDAIAAAGLTVEDIDLIVVATITPEQPLPSTACLLQATLGCRWIPAFDMAAACSGFVWAYLQAAQYVHNGMARNVLVVGAETLTTITDMQDRATCILFGDAAAAAVIRASQRPEAQILASRWGADGERGHLIEVPAGGARRPASAESVADRSHYMKMQGREVYKFAVTQMQAVIQQTCEDAGISPSQVQLIVPHQSNLRIIESATSKLGIAPERVIVNIDRYGNTSSASVPVALHEALAAGRVQPGDLVMLVAFGAGLTWGSVLMRI
jgi:3-oxoacyl-[acyl-carrier-protein] synthase-3